MALALASRLCTSAHAAALEIEDCTVNNATSRVMFDNIKARAAISKIRDPLLVESLRIVQRSPPGSKQPLSETMTREDLVRFTEIRAKLLVTSAQDYLVSERARDVDAIGILWRLGRDKIEGNPTPSDPKSREAILEGLLLAVRDQLKDQSVTLTPPQKAASCDIPQALSLSEAQLLALNHQQAKPVSAAMSEVNGFLLKHPEMHGTMDINKLSTTERSRYDALIKGVLLPELYREQAVKDAELLKIMDRLSAEKVSDGESDLVNSGGDSEAVGRTFNGKQRDRIERVLVGALQYIHDKILSEAVLESQQIIQQTGQTHPLQPSRQ